jgi:hypothetical protein
VLHKKRRYVLLLISLSSKHETKKTIIITCETHENYNKPKGGNKRKNWKMYKARKRRCGSGAWRRT